MAVLIVPDDGDERWPSLGGLICEWMEDNLVFGRGDLLGEPLVLSDEQRGFLYSFYELVPQGEENEGRRRFKRCAISIAKGLAKTELLAFIAAAEVAPDSPVRFDGWDGKGNPKGRPVRDPYIPLIAYTEEQSDELAYGALRAILLESRIGDQFDIGYERIIRLSGDGKVESLAAAPNARDGARTTFSGFDETHWMTLQKLHRAHDVMMQNLAKRKLSDPWSLEVTTAYEPGAGSIAEKTMEHAKAVAEGRAKDPSIFFYHREAGEEHDISTYEGARAAVEEAAGPSAKSWRDFEAIMTLWADPTKTREYWERVWCNRLVQSSRKAFDLAQFKALTKEFTVPEGSQIVVGFDGAQFRDATVLVATHIQSGYQWVAGAWEQPYGQENWQVPADEVDSCVASLFERYNVWRMYADPPYWQSWLATWQGRYGDKRVIEWWTNRRRQMSAALKAYENALSEGSLSHTGDALLVRHIGNAYRHDLPQRDENDQPFWLIRKERSDSPNKIDGAMASVLSWEARNDAIASGVLEVPVFPVEIESITEDLRPH